MSATVLPFDPLRPLLCDGGRQRIQRRRQAIGLEHLFHGSTIGGDRDLSMDHADNGRPSDSAYHAPDDDCA